MKTADQYHWISGSSNRVGHEQGNQNQGKCVQGNVRTKGIGNQREYGMGCPREFNKAVGPVFDNYLRYIYLSQAPRTKCALEALALRLY